MDELIRNTSALQFAVFVLASVCGWLWWRLRKTSEEKGGFQHEYNRLRQKDDHMNETLEDREKQHQGILSQMQQTYKEREESLDAEVRRLNKELSQVSSEKAQLQTEQRSDNEKIDFLKEADNRLGVTFKDLANNILKETTDSLTKTFEQNQKNAKEDLQHRQQAVEQIVKPIRESLAELQKVHSSLDTKVGSVIESIGSLDEETGKLISALRRPEIRGQWGELQLEQCFELAGLQKDIHYKKQPAITDGQRRPDYVVNLPGERHIVVDAKTPIDAYLSAMDAENEQERSALWKRHAGNVKRSADDLSTKRYWDAIQQSPEFVVMFIPSEAFYSAALQHESGLLEYSVNKKVIIATPTNLIALLLIIHMGWQEVKLAREAEKIRGQGHELYRQAGTLVDKILAIRRGLVSSINAYDGAVGSLNRYFTKVQTFSEPISISNEELPELETIAMDPRTPNQRAMLTASNGQDRDDMNNSP